MRVPRYHKTPPGELITSITPLIDVVFLLLIYFLCTVSVAATEQLLPASLLQSGETTHTGPIEIDELEPIRIGLTLQQASLHVELNGHQVANIDELGKRLKQVKAIAELPAVLEVSPEVQLGELVTIYDLCRKAGIARIHFAAFEH
jgi:biopolymer transport protein ExbD